MKESEMRSILGRLCRDLDARRAAGVAVVGTTLALGSGCGGTVETPGPGVEADAAQDAVSDSNAGDAVSEDAAIDSGPLPPYMAPDAGPDSADAADDGPTPVYMSACLPTKPGSGPHA